ncbi:MAG: hypothetical protein ACK5MP_09190 [Nostocoides sp.]
MTRVLWGAILPPYRDAGALLAQRLVTALGRDLDEVVTMAPGRFRHLDPTQPALATRHTVTEEMNNPPESVASIDEFVELAAHSLTGTDTDLIVAGTSAHALSAVAATQAWRVARVTVVMAGAIGSLPSTRSGPQAPAARQDAQRALAQAHQVFAPTASIADQLALESQREVDRIPLGITLATVPQTPTLRLGYAMVGTDLSGLRELGAGLAVLPDSLQQQVSVEVFGERPPATSQWLPHGVLSSVNPTVALSAADRAQVRSTIDAEVLLESAEPARRELTVAMAEALSPVLGIGPAHGVLADLGVTPLPVRHATALGMRLAQVLS